MKLLQEASVDEKFNAQMGKIQDAIQKLEQLCGQFETEKVRPVRSQYRMAEIAAEDLVKLAAKIKSLMHPANRD
jgi:hypothetical protein